MPHAGEIYTNCTRFWAFCRAFLQSRFWQSVKFAKTFLQLKPLLAKRLFNKLLDFICTDCFPNQFFCQIIRTENVYLLYLDWPWFFCSKTPTNHLQGHCKIHYKSKETTKLPQNSWNCEEKRVLVHFIL